MVAIAYPRTREFYRSYLQNCLQAREMLPFQRQSVLVRWIPLPPAANSAYSVFVDRELLLPIHVTKGAAEWHDISQAARSMRTAADTSSSLMS